MPGRMGVDLLVDSGSLGWYRSLQVLRCVIMFISKIQNKLGKSENISSRFCSETDLEKVFFLYESRVNCQLLKPEQTKKFECVDDMIYYRSRVIDETPFMLPTSSMLTLLSIVLRYRSKCQKRYPNQ